MVDVLSTTCTVKDGDLVLTDVRLRSVINTNEEMFLIRPKIGSYVLVADLSDHDLNDLAIIGYSEIDSIEIQIGSETNVVIDEDVVRLNKGDNRLNLYNESLHLAIGGNTEISANNENILLNVGKSKVEIKDDVITFNEPVGEEEEGNGGLVKVKELTKILDKIVDFCNKHTHTNVSFS